MTNPPAGSVRDTAELAKRYSQSRRWQHERGVSLLELADPCPAEKVLDIGCGTGELSAELARQVGPSGQVVAIDPGAARLEHARHSVPQGLDNLTFEQASAEHMPQVGHGSIDLAFSNYALHWVLDPTAVFDELRRVLRPGGRFVAEFLGEPVQLFVDLVLMMPGGEHVVGENLFLKEEEWRQIIAGHGFEILDFAWPQFTLDYEDLPSLFDWLEATSQGAFDAERLRPEDRMALARRFPGVISCPCQGLRMMLRR